METYFRAKPIAKDTWLIEAEGCTCYLLKGEAESLVIDTGYSGKNIRAFAEKLTGNPVRWVANTHGHFDHTADDGWFDKYYMSAGAAETIGIPYPSLEDRYFPPIDKNNIVTVTDGSLIDLGGRVLECFDIPAHSTSIAYLDRTARILFSGDEVAPSVNLRNIVQYAKNMEKLMAVRSEFDYVCYGHGKDMCFASLVDCCYENAMHILEGNLGEKPQMGGPKGHKGPPPIPAPARYETWDKRWDFPRPGDGPGSKSADGSVKRAPVKGDMYSSFWADVRLNYDANTMPKT